LEAKLQEQKEKTKSFQEETKYYKTLGNSMTQKVQKLDSLLRETEQERQVVTFKLTQKSSILKKALIQHDHLKKDSINQQKEMKKMRERSKKIGKMLSEQCDKLKKEERLRYQAEIELEQKEKKLADLENRIKQNSEIRSPLSTSPQSIEMTIDMLPISPDGFLRNVPHYQPSVDYPDRDSVLSLSNQVNDLESELISFERTSSLDNVVTVERDERESSSKKKNSSSGKQEKSPSMELENYTIGGRLRYQIQPSPEGSVVRSSNTETKRLPEISARSDDNEEEENEEIIVNCGCMVVQCKCCRRCVIL